MTEANGHETIALIEAKVRKTLCNTYSSAGVTYEGRITGVDFETLLSLAQIGAAKPDNASLLKALDEAKAALEYARPIVERWCHTQGNNKQFFADTLKPIDSALSTIQKDQK